MSDNSYNPEPVNPSRTVGGKRATLALVVALAALGFSIYGLASHVLESDKTPPPALPADASALDALQSRIEAQEARAGQLAEDMAKISSRLDELAKAPQAAPAAEEAKGSVEDLRSKLGEVEKTNSAIQGQIREMMLRRARWMTDLSLMQSIQQKLQVGIDFSRERKELSDDVHGLPDGDKNFHALEVVSNPAPLADKALLDDLRALAPHFVAIEKMESTNGFFGKLWLRVQNLVTIRPKEGIAPVTTAAGKNLQALQAAVSSHLWPSALEIAEGLQAKAPAEFAGWRQRLQSRAESEAALETLGSATLRLMREDKFPEATPVAAPAPEEKPAPTPSSPPEKKTAPPAAPVTEEDKL